MKHKSKFGIFWVGILLFVFLVGGVSFASGSEEYKDEIEELKARIEMLEKKIEEAEKERKELKEEANELKSIKEKFKNLSVHIGVTGIVQGTVNNDDNCDEGDVVDGSYSADLEFEADFGRWGTGYLYLEAGGGEEGITDEVPALTGVNADANDFGDNVKVSEAWWEFKPLNNDLLTLTIGKLDPVRYFDANEVANDETTQFLADAFVNSIVVEWPDYTPSFRVQISPIELVDVNLAVMSADSDWEDLFDDVFLIGEINVKPKFGDLQGNYRIYGWMNGLDHVEWDDFKRSGYNENITDDEKNYGVGISLDQQIPYNITLFARVGYQDDDIAGVVGELDEPFGVSWMWSVGAQITGNMWSRPDDVVGLAVGQAILSSDYEDYLKANDTDPDDETHLELYYNLHLNDHISLTPDFQVIDALGGDEDADTVYIFGLRSQIDF